jgi:hypothetical protein
MPKSVSGRPEYLNNFPSPVFYLELTVLKEWGFTLSSPSLDGRGYSLS